MDKKEEERKNFELFLTEVAYLSRTHRYAEYSTLLQRRAASLLYPNCDNDLTKKRKLSGDAEEVTEDDTEGMYGNSTSSFKRLQVAHQKSQRDTNNWLGDNYLTSTFVNISDNREAVAQPLQRSSTDKTWSLLPNYNDVPLCPPENIMASPPQAADNFGDEYTLNPFGTIDLPSQGSSNFDILLLGPTVDDDPLHLPRMQEDTMGLQAEKVDEDSTNPGGTIAQPSQGSSNFESEKQILARIDEEIGELLKIRKDIQKGGQSPAPLPVTVSGAPSPFVAAAVPIIVGRCSITQGTWATAFRKETIGESAKALMDELLTQEEKLTCTIKGMRKINNEWITTPKVNPEILDVIYHAVASMKSVIKNQSDQKSEKIDEFHYNANDFILLEEKEKKELITNVNYAISQKLHNIRQRNKT